MGNKNEFIVAKVSARSPLTNKLASATSAALTLVDSSPLRRVENVIVARGGPFEDSVVNEIQPGIDYDIYATFYNPTLQEVQEIRSYGVVFGVELLQSGVMPFEHTTIPTEITYKTSPYYPGEYESVTFKIGITNVGSSRSSFRFIIINASNQAEIIRSEQCYLLLHWEWVLKAGDHLTLDLIGGGATGGGWNSYGENYGQMGATFDFRFDHYDVGPQAANQNLITTRMTSLSEDNQIWVGGGMTDGAPGVPSYTGGEIRRKPNLDQWFEFESVNPDDNLYWDGVRGATHNGRLGGINQLYPTLGAGGNGANSAGNWGGGGAGAILSARIKVKDDLQGVLLFGSTGNVFDANAPIDAPAGVTGGRRGRGSVTFERATEGFPNVTTFNYGNDYT